MPKLIWFNQPTNHSGTANFLYLTPDGDVGEFSIYSDYGRGAFIMGGPALLDDRGATQAALTLISFLDSGFHFFPQESEETIRQVAEKNKGEEVSHYAPVIDDNGCVYAYSKDYSPAQCRDLLLSNTSPQFPIVFVDIEESGEDVLAYELARIYLGLSKQQRDQLGLKHDWKPHWSFG